MDPDNIANILSRLKTQPYVTQEVRFGYDTGLPLVVPD